MRLLWSFVAFLALFSLTNTTVIPREPDETAGQLPDIPLLELEKRQAKSREKPKQVLESGDTWLHCNAFSVCEALADGTPTFCRKGYFSV